MNDVTWVAVGYAVVIATIDAYALILVRRLRKERRR